MSKRLKDWLDSLPSYPEMDIPYDEWLMSLKEGDKVVAFTCDVFGYSSNNTPRISVDKIESLNSNSVKFAHNKNRISRKTGACNKNEYDTMVWIAPNEEIGIALVNTGSLSKSSCALYLLNAQQNQTKSMRF